MCRSRVNTFPSLFLLGVGKDSGRYGESVHGEAELDYCCRSQLLLRRRRRVIPPRRTGGMMLHDDPPAYSRWVMLYDDPHSTQQVGDAA